MQFPSSLLLLVVSSLIAACASQELSNATRHRNSTGCLRRFENDPSHFAPCLTEVCFLFRRQKPYVQMDPSMKSEQDQNLFRCRAPSTYSPHLSGIAFEMHKELTGPDYWCVWAGNDCMFNNLVDFVEIQAERSQHQFAITGILLETSVRLSKNLHSSSPIMDSRMIVVGRRAEDDIIGTLDQLTKAFKRETWVLIGLLFVVYLALIVAHVLAFCPEPLSLKTIFNHFMGDREEDIKQSYGEEARTQYRASLWFLTKVMVFSLVLVVTFYELAAVNYLFIKKPIKLGKLVSNLSPAERAEYAVLKDSAVEYIWMQTIGAQVNDPKPWYRCDDEMECLAKVLDKNHPARHIFTADLLVWYKFRKRDQCDVLTVYKTEDRTSQCGAGWLFGGRVPAPERLRINKEILNMRVNGKIGTIVERVIGGPENFQCGQDANSIGPAILGLPLAILVVPLLLPLVVLIFIGLYQSCARGRSQSQDLVE